MDLNRIRILQANCWKSCERVMIHLFGEKEVRDLEILAIQEPYINRHTDQVTTYSQMLGNRSNLLIKPTSKDTCDGSRMIAHIRRLSTTELDDTSQTLPKHVANVAFKTTPSSR